MPQVKSIIYAEASRLCQIFCFGLIFYVFVISGLNASPGCEPCEEPIMGSSGRIEKCEYVGDGNPPFDSDVEGICCEGQLISINDCCEDNKIFYNGDDITKPDSSSKGVTLPIHEIISSFKSAADIIPGIDVEPTVDIDATKNVSPFDRCCAGERKELKIVKITVEGEVAIEGSVPLHPPLSIIAGLYGVISVNAGVAIEVSGTSDCSGGRLCGSSVVNGKISGGIKGEVLKGYALELKGSLWAMLNISESKLCYDTKADSWDFNGGDGSLGDCGAEVEITLLTFIKEKKSFPFPGC